MQVQPHQVTTEFNLVQVSTCPEEGTPIIGESYFVLITLDDGSRFEHNVRFPSLFWVDDSECEFGGYWDRIDAAEQADDLLRRIIIRGEVDLAHWRSVRPAYSSEAYIQGDWSRQDAEREREDDLAAW